MTLPAEDRDRLIAKSGSLNFLEALLVERPIRRASWTKVGPQRPALEAVVEAFMQASWLVPRIATQKEGESIWVNLATGQLMALRRDDYLAMDWEVLP